MGRIRTKDIKDLARDLHSAYSDRFTFDFEQNKREIGELKIMEGRSKRFRNKVAGYIVRLARQAMHGHHAAGERAPEGGEPGPAEMQIESATETAATAEEKEQPTRADEAKPEAAEAKETPQQQEEPKSE